MPRGKENRRCHLSESGIRGRIIYGNGSSVEGPGACEPSGTLAGDLKYVGFWIVSPDRMATLVRLPGGAFGATLDDIAKTDPETLADLRLFQTSTKIAFDGSGVIAYRAVHGGGDPKIWRQVFREIADSAMQ